MATPTHPGPRLFGRQARGSVVEDDPVFLQSYLQASRNAAAERASQQVDQRGENLAMLRALLEGQNQMALEQQRAKDAEARNWVPLPAGTYAPESPIGKAMGAHPELGPGMKSQTFNALTKLQEAYDTKQATKAQMANWLTTLPPFKTPGQMPSMVGDVPELISRADQGWNIVREHVRQSSETGQPLALPVEQALARHISVLLGDKEGTWMRSDVPGLLYHSITGETKPLAGYTGPSKTMDEHIQDLQDLQAKHPGVKLAVSQPPGKEATISATTTDPSSAKTLVDESLRVARMAPGPEKDKAAVALKEASGYQAQQAINVFTAQEGVRQDRPVGAKAVLWVNKAGEQPSADTPQSQLTSKGFFPIEQAQLDAETGLKVFLGHIDDSEKMIRAGGIYPAKSNIPFVNILTGRGAKAYRDLAGTSDETLSRYTYLHGAIGTAAGTFAKGARLGPAESQILMKLIPGLDEPLTQEAALARLSQVRTRLKAIVQEKGFQARQPRTTVPSFSEWRATQPPAR